MNNNIEENISADFSPLRLCSTLTPPSKTLFLKTVQHFVKHFRLLIYSTAESTLRFSSDLSISLHIFSIPPSCFLQTRWICIESPDLDSRRLNLFVLLYSKSSRREVERGEERTRGGEAQGDAWSGEIKDKERERVSREKKPTLANPEDKRGA